MRFLVKTETIVEAMDKNCAIGQARSNFLSSEVEVIEIRKPQPHCDLCGKQANLSFHHGHALCSACCSK